MFADDTKIWKKIQKNQEDIEALQRDLLTLESKLVRAVASKFQH